MAFFCVLSSNAEAKHYKSYHNVTSYHKHFKTVTHKRFHLEHQYSHLAQQTHRRFSNSRPQAWCGWQMRQWLGVADDAYNLARNWAHYGRPSVPGVGVLVVWSHHVGIITGRDLRNNKWIIKSGNDGHGVRERPRSIAGAIAFRTS